MIEETKEQLKWKRYGCWAGCERGYGYKAAQCAEVVWKGMLSYQCSKKNGFGREKLFCKQHAKKNLQELP